MVTDSSASAPRGGSAAPKGGRALLDRLRDKKTALLGEDVIGARPPGPAPLSFAQERLWFITQLEPLTPRFNILTAVRLRGRLRREVVVRVLDEIVRRHEALRTRFEVRDGQPIQTVAPGLRLAVPTIDLDGLDPRRQELLLHRLVSGEAADPFDLERGPLLRARLLRFAADHHVLFLTLHQIVVDRWSRGILVREVVALYGAFAAGLSSRLPELPIQYADFAVWQRRHLTGDLLAQLLGYWRERLAPPLPVLELATDRPRPAVQGHRGRMQYFVLPAAELAQLQALAKQEGATLFMVLLAALTALLHRYSGQQDMVVGAPIVNRHRQEIENLIGFFLNLLALRLRPGSGMAFRELLAEARAVALGAYAHQELPFERLVEELEVERDLARHPLLQVALVLQNAPLPQLELPELTAGLVEIDWGSTAFDLAFFFWETAMWESLQPGLSLTTSCSSALFDAATVVRLVGHLRNLLLEAAAHPERALGELAILTAAERQQLVVEWNDGSEAPPVGELVQLFAAQAAMRADAVALDFPDGCLTFGQVNRLAGSVARRLRRSGVGAEVPVAVPAERSWRAIVGFLAALQAGGCYLPLAPEDPPERRAAIVAAAGATLLAEVAGSEGAGEDDGRGAAANREEEEGVWPLPGGEATACVLFTSGSAGAPKGVRVTRRAIGRLARDNGFLALAAGDRVAQASNLGFDAASFEIWGSLLTGATLVGFDPAARLSPAELAAALRRAAVTTLFLPTALFHQLAAGDPAAFAGVRDLLIGGEAPEPAAVRPVLEHSLAAHGGRLFHLYGPTEATTFSTWERVREVAAGAVRLPAGRPLPGWRIRILDPGGRPAPIGVLGEVAIGGVGLAQGYVGAADRTAASFVPDPWGAVAGARLFRTGDLGRLLADGRLELHGRGDRQLKVRGYRVEPGEVEAALLAHPAVGAAAVVATAGREGLAAYVVPRAALAEADLREHLRQRLPAYMVPSAFVQLAALPLTPRGKLDPGALPPAAAPPREVRAVAPRTAAESLLAGVWSEVLGREVGVEDDFFELGGHSLQITRIVSRLRSEHQLEIAVKTVFERRSVAALAASLPPGAGRR